MAFAIIHALLSRQMRFLLAIEIPFTWPHDTREKKLNSCGCNMSGMFKFSVIAYDPRQAWETPHINLDIVK